MKTIIHINQHNIKHNNKPDTLEADKKPVITVKTYKSNEYANAVFIVDDAGNIIARIVYSPDKPLSCGAHVWIEASDKNVICLADNKNVKCLNKVGEPYEPIPS